MKKICLLLLCGMVRISAMQQEACTSQDCILQAAPSTTPLAQPEGILLPIPKEQNITSPSAVAPAQEQRYIDVPQPKKESKVKKDKKPSKLSEFFPCLAHKKISKDK